MPRGSRLAGGGFRLGVGWTTGSTAGRISTSGGSIDWAQQPQVKQVGGQFWSPPLADSVSPSHGSVQEIAMAPEALKTRTATPKIMASRLTNKRIAGRTGATLDRILLCRTRVSATRPGFICTLPVPK